MALPGCWNSRPSVHHLNFPRPADHSCHCQQEGEQTKGKIGSYTMNIFFSFFLLGDNIIHSQSGQEVLTLEWVGGKTYPNNFFLTTSTKQVRIR